MQQLRFVKNLVFNFTTILFFVSLKSFEQNVLRNRLT